MVHSFNNNHCLPMMKADEVLLFYENESIILHSEVYEST